MHIPNGQDERSKEMGVFINERSACALHWMRVACLWVHGLLGRSPFYGLWTLEKCVPIVNVWVMYERCCRRPFDGGMWVECFLSL